MNKLLLKYNPKIELLNIIGDYLYGIDNFIAIEMASRLQRIIYHDIHKDLVTKFGKNINQDGEFYIFQIVDIGYDIEDGIYLITIDEEDCCIYNLTNAYLVDYNG